MMIASYPMPSFRVAACVIFLASTFGASVVSADDGRVLHMGRVVSSTAVSTSRGQGASRASGTLGLGDACSCDEDCDAGLGDQCNIVQCIVRGVCSGDNTTPCSTAKAGGSADADCEENEQGEPNGVCQQSSVRQRCDVVQLISWPCDVDIDFCTTDQCEDDGTGTGTSVCTPQNDGAGGALSACPKQCAGGPARPAFGVFSWLASSCLGTGRLGQFRPIMRLWQRRPVGFDVAGLQPSFTKYASWPRLPNRRRDALAPSRRNP